MTGWVRAHPKYARCVVVGRAGCSGKEQCELTLSDFPRDRNKVVPGDFVPRPLLTPRLPDSDLYSQYLRKGCSFIEALHG